MDCATCPIKSDLDALRLALERERQVTRSLRFQLQGAGLGDLVSLRQWGAERSIPMATVYAWQTRHAATFPQPQHGHRYWSRWALDEWLRKWQERKTRH
jgi:hypothetical protein